MHLFQELGNTAALVFHEKIKHNPEAQADQAGLPQPWLVSASWIDPCSASCF